MREMTNECQVRTGTRCVQLVNKVRLLTLIKVLHPSTIMVDRPVTAHNLVQLLKLLLQVAGITMLQV